MQLFWSNEDWGTTSGFTPQTVGDLVYTSVGKVTAGAGVGRNKHMLRKIK